MSKVSKVLSKSVKNAEKTLYVSSYNSPVGEIINIADDEHVYAVIFSDVKNYEARLQNLAKKLQCDFKLKKNGILSSLEEEFIEYFKGTLKEFTVPIKTIGSEFQKEVWQTLIKLPYGSTQSYGDLAKLLNRSASHSRAIGAACGANNHLIVVPCHRLVASGANKMEYNSGGHRKTWLLEHEKKHS